MTLTYRWLGAAGLEFTADDYVLLVDPFFTRPRRAAMALGARVRSNESLAARCAPRADAVLITHPHYDHILDVPGILRRSGARAYGSPNAGTLLGWHHIPAEQVARVQPGQRFRAGPFEVDVLPGYHRPVPMAWLWNGPLGSGPLPSGPRLHDPRLPLRLSDYRMDACYAFRITLGGRSLLVGSYPAPADVFFATPYQPDAGLARVLRAAQPGQVIPIHWDDFNRPLDQPLRPMLLTPGEDQPPFPPLRRVDLDAFARLVKRVLPSAAVQTPRLFEKKEI